MYFSDISVKLPNVGVQSCLNENKNLHISSDNFDSREIVREKKSYMEDFI